jgi:GT2 family glycosyltransferase
MSAAPILSVVIPSYNRTDLLSLCLTSVLRHAPRHTEVIVVDDASPAGCASATAARFAGVRALRLPERGGFCVAANAGIGVARAPVVELLNDDTQVTAGWADAPMRCFGDPAVAAVAPLVLRGPSDADPPVIDSAGDLYDLGGVARKRGHGEPLADAYLRPCLVFGASASSAFYRRDAVTSVGAFPESFGAYFEDVDLSFRLRRAGHQIRYEPRSVVWHRVSASYGRRDRRSLERQSHNEEQVFWRNLPADVLLQSLPRHVAVLAGKAVRRWREGELRPFVSGRLRAFAGWRDVWRHRRELAGKCDVRPWLGFKIAAGLPASRKHPGKPAAI